MKNKYKRILPTMYIFMVIFLIFTSCISYGQNIKGTNEKNKQAIATAISNVNIDISKVPFHEIAEKFKNEFSKKEIYEPLLGIKYENIGVETSQDTISFSFETPFYNNSMNIERFFTFKRVGICSKDNDNCNWNCDFFSGNCKLIIDENGKIIN